LERVAELEFALNEALEVEAVERSAAETAGRRVAELDRAMEEMRTALSTPVAPNDVNRH
jgi:hypothetical protein